MHKISQDLEFGQKGWNGVLTVTQTESRRERDRGREVLLTKRGRGQAQAHNRRRVAGGGEVTGGGEGDARETERNRGSVSAPGSGGERFFKNGVWTHRTVYSACPVHTGQRTEKWSLSARLPVHRTLHSAVSGAHRTVR
jgi:hypothetical protein